MNRVDQTLNLPDGRSLCFAEFGEPEGIPLLYCHGFPASRLEGRLIERAATRQGIRAIVPDRPGYGGSTLHRGQRISDWPEDVERLADHLGLATFLLLGVSGGGPYALATAAKLGRRLQAVGLVCPLGPVYCQEALAPMQTLTRWAFSQARCAPGLLRLLFGGIAGPLMRTWPGCVLSLLMRTAPAADWATLRRPEIRRVLSESIREALRRGPEGVLRDFAVFANAWDFDPLAIEGPVTIWHGADDRTVPASHSRMLADRLRTPELRIVPGEGHFSLPIQHGEEILEALVQKANPHDARRK